MSFQKKGEGALRKYHNSFFGLFIPLSKLQIVCQLIFYLISWKRQVVADFPSFLVPKQSASTNNFTSNHLLEVGKHSIILLTENCSAR